MMESRRSLDRRRLEKQKALDWPRVFFLPIGCVFFDSRRTGRRRKLSPTSMCFQKKNTARGRGEKRSDDIEQGAAAASAQRGETAVAIKESPRFVRQAAADACERAGVRANDDVDAPSKSAEGRTLKKREASAFEKRR